MMPFHKLLLVVPACVAGIACGHAPALSQIVATFPGPVSIELQPGVFGWSAMPPPLNCGPIPPFTVAHGKVDNFGVIPDPAPQPSPYLTSLGVTNGPPNVFDRTSPNYKFGDSLKIGLPQGSMISSARLTTRLKPLDTASNLAGPSAANDGINLHVSGSSPSSGAPGYGLTALKFSPWGTPHPGSTFSFDLKAAPPLAPLFSAINASLANTSVPTQLDVYVQDDTAVDFTLLEVCPGGPHPETASAAGSK